jgi:hypothetical protein
MDVLPEGCSPLGFEIFAWHLKYSSYTRYLILPTAVLCPTLGTVLVI